MKFNWGHGILTFIILFIGFMAFMVSKSSQQKAELIATDYYARELAYQDKINMTHNYEELSVKPEFNFFGSYLVLKFDHKSSNNFPVGDLKLLRPSDKSLDKSYTFNESDSGLFKIHLSELVNGLYSVELKWTDGSKSYFQQKDIVIP